MTDLTVKYFQLFLVLACVKCRITISYLAIVAYIVVGLCLVQNVQWIRSNEDCAELRIIGCRGPRFGNGYERLVYMNWLSNGYILG